MLELHALGLVLKIKEKGEDMAQQCMILWPTYEVDFTTEMM